MLSTNRLIVVMVVVFGGLIIDGCATVQTPPELENAILIGNINKIKSIVEANPKLVDSTSKIGGKTPLYCTMCDRWRTKDDGSLEKLPINKEVAMFLINNRANINVKGKPSDKTLLHCAAESGEYELAELLIDKGVNVNAKSYYGDTPLHEALYNGHKDIAELLIDKGANVNVKDKSDGKTLLHLAVQSGRKDIVELLIAKGADVNAKVVYSRRVKRGAAPFSDDGFTALHYASERNNIEIVELLIANGANVNAKDDEGRTPLYYAEQRRNTDVAELLRKHGAVE